MTRSIIYIVLALCIASCGKKYLEIVPLGDQVAVTTSDYDKLMNDPAFYFSSGGGGLSEAQLMGDDVDAEAAFFNGVDQTGTRDRLFQWSDTPYQRTTTLPLMLQKELTQRYELNKIIIEVMSSTGGTDQQKRSILAEAMATRAWSNFQLASYYCKPYNASTAGTDPGFPIIDTRDVNVTHFTRGTVQQTYDSIIADFRSAISDLPVTPVTPTRMSRAAAEGLLGKVYLFMGRSSDALPLLTDALSIVTTSGFARLYDYNQTLGPGGAFQPIDPYFGPQGPGQNYSDLTEAVLSKVFYNGSYTGNGTGNNGLVLSDAMAALFQPGDLRLLFYTSNDPDGSPNPDGRLRKFVTYSRWGLQLPELILLSAECKARTNDLSGAKADVESLRVKRMPPADAVVPADTVANQTAMIKFIIDERVREFAMEGYRWNDMRRLSLDGLYTGISFIHHLYDGSGGTTSYTLRQPNRLTLRLPPYIVDSNPGMENNP